MGKGDAHRQMRSQTFERMLEALASGVSDKRGVQKAAGLSWGAVSDGIALLESKGVVQSADIPPEEGRLGRRPSSYRLSTSRNLALGLVLEDTKTFASLVALSGEPVFRDVIVHSGRMDIRNAVKRVEAAYAHVMGGAHLPPNRIGRVGLSLPGAVDPESMTWAHAPFSSMKGHAQFERLLKPRPHGHPVPLSVEHDVVSIARAVMKREQWADKDFAFLNFSEGVGMAVAFKGRFFAGSRGYACEIGHVPLSDGKHARPCRCGKTGCIETMLSTGGVALTAKELLGLGDGASFARLVKEMDGKSSRRIYAAILPKIVHACVVALNLFAPGTLVLGGPAIEPWLGFLEKDLPDQLRSSSWMGSPANIRFYDRGGRDECAYGAALGAAGLLLQSLADALSSK